MTNSETQGRGPESGVAREATDVAVRYWGASPDGARLAAVSGGLINHTFRLTIGDTPFFLQKINTRIFADPALIQRNIAALARHLQEKGYPREILQIKPTLDGSLFVCIGQAAWRMFYSIQDTCVFGTAQSVNQVFEAARFVGEFHAYARDMNPAAIQPVLPGFLNFRDRISAFKTSIRQAGSGRIASAKSLIDFAFRRIDLPERFSIWQESGILPTRLIHADPKIGNLLFDALTQLPKALIDWDTLMFGSCLYDFGDMARSCCNLSEEDYVGPEPVFSLEMYDALEQGYLQSASPWLNDIERRHLRYAAAVIVYIQFLRFLSDYLSGDVYYQVDYPEQNRRRAVNQMRLLEGMGNG